MKLSALSKRILTLLFICFLTVQKSSALNFKFVYCPNNLQIFPQNVRDSIAKAGKTLGSYIGNNHTVTIVVKSAVTADAVGTGSPKTAIENTADKYIALSGVYTINPTANANFVVLTQHELLHILGVTGGLNAFKNKISNSAFTGSKTKQMNNGNAFPLSGDSHLSRAAAYPLTGMNAAVRDGGGSFSVMDLALLFDLGYDIPLLTTRTTAVHPLPTGTVANTSNSDVCEDLSTISPELFISNSSKQIVNINKCFCATPQYNVNGGGFSNTLPTYNATTPLTIQVKYVCDNDNTKQSPTKTFNTYPICPVDLSSVVTGAVKVTESVNGVGGLIEAPTVSNCPPGSYLTYRTNPTDFFTRDIPIYDKTKTINVSTRCFCESDGSKGSKVTTVTTKPGISTATTTPPTPVPAPGPATIAPATNSSNSFSNAVVRFKNRYTPNQWINIEGGPVASGNVPAAFVSGQWRIVPVAGTKFVRLQSVWKPTLFLNIEKGPIEASVVPDAFLSGHWELEEVIENKAAGAPTHYRLKSRWKPEIYLNTEKGKLEASAVPTAFQSANWIIERI